MKEEMSKRSDAAITSELLEQAKAKDKEALGQLYEKTQLDIYRTVHAMIRDEDLTLDIQQDTYLKAFSRLDQLRNAASFLPWLRQIAVNEARAQLTKKRPMAFSELSDDGEEDSLFPEQPDLRTVASPELALDRKETNRLIREILDGLSDGQRMLLGMFYYERLPLRRIAEDTGLSEGTIKAQLHRGRKRVETEVKKLEAQGIKLYGLSPVAFLVALMGRTEPTVTESVRQAAVKAVVAKASADTVAVTAAPVAAMTFGQVLAGRVLAGALAVALIVGGIWGGAKLLKSNKRDNPYQPTTVETGERLSGVETTEENPETNEDLPVITEPAATEPAVTEPAVTEPAVTELAETQPAETQPAETQPAAAGPTQPSESTEPSDPTEPSAGKPDVGLIVEGWHFNHSENDVYGYQLEPGTFQDLIWDRRYRIEIRLNRMPSEETNDLPSVYSDNPSVVSIYRVYGTFGGTGDGCDCVITCHGPGTAHLTIDFGGGQILRFTFINPEYPPELISASTYTNFEDCCPDTSFEISVVVQGLDCLPELTTDNPAIFSGATREGFSSGETDWIRRGYIFRGKIEGVGDGHIFLMLNGETVYTWTVHAHEQSQE